MVILPKRLHAARYVRRPAVAARRLERPDRVLLDLAVVAFENDAILEEQLRSLTLHLHDEHRVTVFDNSPTDAGRERIARVADAHDLGYASLPANPLTGRDPSGSHGLALNWAYEQVLKHRDSELIGTLDPDVFAVADTSVTASIGTAPCWGFPQVRGERWYLWAGFSFFRRAACPPLDFMPGDGLDTGGGNWSRLYRHLSLADVEFPETYYLDSDAPPGRTPQRFGDWLHTFNSSQWRDA